MNDRVASVGNGRWRVRSGEIAIEPIGENEYAVFHPAFADSTLINAIDMCLLQELIQLPIGWPEDELVRIAAGQLDLELDPQLIHYVGESLKQMEFVGLIFREQPDGSKVS